MSNFFKVSIYNDCPGANPKSVTFDYAAESSEVAREKGLSLSRILYSSGQGISVYARASDEAGHKSGDIRPVYLERTPLVRFRAVHLSRVLQEVGPLDFVKIPNGRWWFEKAECYMTKEERQKMAALGIGFEVVSPMRSDDFRLTMPPPPPIGKR